MKFSMENVMRLISILTLFICSTSWAGDFKILDDDGTTVTVHYTGMVEPLDPFTLGAIIEVCVDRHIVIIIDSGGGYAWAGVDLYWEAKKHDNLTLVAGSKLGAWSAAAIFWLADDEHLLMPDGIVGFHLAYCNSYNPPGCNTLEIDAAMQEILEEGFGCKAADTLRDHLEWARGMFGVHG